MGVSVHGCASMVVGVFVGMRACGWVWVGGLVYMRDMMYGKVCVWGVCMCVSVCAWRHLYVPGMRLYVLVCLNVCLLGVRFVCVMRCVSAWGGLS